mgnify:CR=1 FL=1
MKYPFFFLLIICFQDCGSCDLDPETCIRTYTFEIPLQVTPQTDTFSVGDTLWLSSYIPAELEDSATGEKINVLNHDFKLESTIERMDTLGALDAEYDFDIINEIGEQTIVIKGPYFTSKYKYLVQKDTQMLKIGLVPTKPGLYELVFYYLTKNLQAINLTDTDCKEHLSLSNNMNNGADNNYHLLLESPNPIDTPEGFKKDSGYAFIVIE